MIKNYNSSINKDNMIVKCFWIAIAICWCKIILDTFSKFSINSAWDDSYMFIRYADNILAHGKISWHPGGIPSYGLTSNLFLIIVLPTRFLLPDNPALAIALSSLMCGFLFLGLITFLLKHYTNTNDPVVRLIVILLIFFNFTLSIKHLGIHFVSGMDTSFVLASITIYIILSKKHEYSSSIVTIILLGVLGGLAYSVRPDLMIYTFIIPISIIVFGANHKTKRSALVILSITATVIVAQLWFAYHYFNSFLPLSFYAKGLGLYGDFIHKFYSKNPVKELLDYISSYWCLWLIICVNLVINFKACMRRSSPVEKGLIIASCFFILYYLFFVLQIGHYHQRFYYPTLPAIILLAGQSAICIGRKIPHSAKKAFQKNHKLLFLIIIFSLLCYFFVSSKPMQVIPEIFNNNFSNFNLFSQKWISKRWFLLKEFSALPNDLVIATTEIGRPAAMNPKKVIIDLAGLNETEFAHKGFSANILFKKYHPDLIYMPHPHYKNIIKQISSHPYFINRYEHFSASKLGIRGMGIALWRNSKYYQAMRKIVENEVSF